jgi:hypothetical protein
MRRCYRTGQEDEGTMGDLEIVTTADRHDLDEQARDAFRVVWPEFIFHDPISSEYIGQVETSDGLHIDPWIRTHQRLGASILASAPRSMTITGTVPEWEDWAAMAFPETGQYVVADALDLVTIDRERDQGAYAETNLWMRHV